MAHQMAKGTVSWARISCPAPSILATSSGGVWSISRARRVFVFTSDGSRCSVRSLLICALACVFVRLRVLNALAVAMATATAPVCPSWCQCVTWAESLAWCVSFWRSWWNQIPMGVALIAAPFPMDPPWKASFECVSQLSPCAMALRVLRAIFP